MGSKFVLHILLSLGRFQTERQILLKENLTECFREEKLIGISNDEDSLIQHSNKIMKIFTKKQLKLYDNGMRVIDYFIVLTGDLFDSVVIEKKIR